MGLDSLGKAPSEGTIFLSSRHRSNVAAPESLSNIQIKQFFLVDDSTILGRVEECREDSRVKTISVPVPVVVLPDGVRRPCSLIPDTSRSDSAIEPEVLPRPSVGEFLQNGILGKPTGEVPIIDGPTGTCERIHHHKQNIRNLRKSLSEELAAENYGLADQLEQEMWDEKVMLKEAERELKEADSEAAKCRINSEPAVETDELDGEAGISRKELRARMESILSLEEWLIEELAARNFGSAERIEAYIEIERALFVDARRTREEQTAKKPTERPVKGRAATA